MMNKQIGQLTLENIRNLTGMEEFKRLIEEWYLVSQNRNKLPKKACIILPNCLLSIQSGTGVTKLLGMMTQFLEESRLLEFIGDIKYFEFVLDYSENTDNFLAFSRLIETFRAAAGFRGIYKGLACINISEWLDHLQDRRFLRFLEYTADCNDDILFVFTVPSLEIEKKNELEATLISYLRLRYLKLDLPNNDALYLYIQERLQKQGFSLDKKASSVLKETLEISRQLPSFNGYNTLNQLVRDIIYEKSSHELLEHKMITVQDLQHFSPIGQWIKQLKGYKIQHNKRAGFAMGGK